METPQIKVGVGVMIFKDGKVLMTKRKSLHGQGEYSFPGGHIEYMESFEDAVHREVMEEAGIKIKNLKFLHVANVLFYKPKHYINTCFTADWESGVPQIMESEKSEDWNWYDLNDLPSPIFRQSLLAIESYTTGKNYYNEIK